MKIAPDTNRNSDFINGDAESRRILWMNHDTITGTCRPTGGSFARSGDSSCIDASHTIAGVTRVMQR